eukprot:1433734-Rhodomonas_salina.2
MKGHGQRRSHSPDVNAAAAGLEGRWEQPDGQRGGSGAGREDALRVQLGSWRSNPQGGRPWHWHRAGSETMCQWVKAALKHHQRPAVGQWVKASASPVPVSEVPLKDRVSPGVEAAKVQGP